MPLRFAYTNSAGGVSIFYPEPIERLKRVLGEGLSDKEYRAHVVSRGIPSGAENAQELPEGLALPDKCFRDAWVMTEAGIVVDMPKAREIHRDRMRAARAPKLAALDIEFQRTLEDGKATGDVVSAKQALRDLTKHPDIDKAMTPEELKQVWPEVLA